MKKRTKNGLLKLLYLSLGLGTAFSIGAKRFFDNPDNNVTPVGAAGYVQNYVYANEEEAREEGWQCYDWNLNPNKALCIIIGKSIGGGNEIEQLGTMVRENGDGEWVRSDIAIDKEAMYKARLTALANAGAEYFRKTGKLPDINKRFFVRNFLRKHYLEDLFEIPEATSIDGKEWGYRCREDEGYRLGFTDINGRKAIVAYNTGKKGKETCII